MDEHSGKENILCPNCGVTLRVPKTQHPLRIRCPECTSVFFHNLPKKPSASHKKLIVGAAIVVVIVIFALLYQDDQSRTLSGTRSAANQALLSNWISISYGGLVDRTLFTHSGETVGAVISQIPQYDDEFKGLVQSFLEPFSILCHDVLLSINGPDTLPFINIVNHYPIGSEQPAWTALFREGHYQLYYSPTKIRVFLKGTNAKQSFEKNKSVIRHAIRDVINSDATKIDSVEVFVFTNDYASTTIKLNTIPASYSLQQLDLGPQRQSIDLSAIEEFLGEGVILEAVEADENNDLYFYGKAARNQTLAGEPLSLADLAVIYRSVFHYGYNSPYISLDKHEDNRYAKVNFGGYLENTHVGHVVLGADKLFKALSTGIDPNTHRVIRDRIAREVPAFLTEDELSLLDNSVTGHTQIRYWFYPDEIGTVTDGAIGAVLSYQFLADVERMDMPLSVSSAVTRTITHLNKNFGQYERAFETFRELSTVGRLMALVNWLKVMDVTERVELDELLSVKIPAFRTPSRTKKMLAITAVAYSDVSHLSAQNIREFSKVYYISDLIDKCIATTSDKQFLQLASEYFDSLDIDELAPHQYKSLKSQAEALDKTITYYDDQLESLDAQIRQSERTLNEYSTLSVNRHNKLVNKYNSIQVAQKKRIYDYNVVIDRINNVNLVSNCITSVGGGINLRPKEFKKISRSRNAPRIKEIISVKSRIQTFGKITKAGNWIRSRVGKSGARLNVIPIDSWILEKAADGSLIYSYASGGSNRLAFRTSVPGGGWRSEASINGIKEVVQVSEADNTIQVVHPGVGISGTARVSKNAKRIVFNR